MAKQIKATVTVTVSGKDLSATRRKKIAKNISAYIRRVGESRGVKFEDDGLGDPIGGLNDVVLSIKAK